MYSGVSAGLGESYGVCGDYADSRGNTPSSVGLVLDVSFFAAGLASSIARRGLSTSARGLGPRA